MKDSCWYYQTIGASPVEFNGTTIPRFCNAIGKAIANNNEYVEFGGTTFPLPYAKDLCDYLVHSYKEDIATMSNRTKSDTLRDSIKSTDKLIELTERKVKLLHDLKKSLTQALQKETHETVDSVNFTVEKLKRFKNIYNQAVEDDRETFTFEEKVFVVGYAKYMIEYLENQLYGKR